MLSTKNTNQKALINDVVKTAVIMIIVHILVHTRENKKLFDTASLFVILSWSLAFVFYHVVFVNFVPPV
jgi:hypothetical protein